jgi:hypothetical protein
MTGMIIHDDTSLEWDEAKNQLKLIAQTQYELITAYMNYKQARDILDCLMVVFGRMDIMYRYPEAR